MAELERWLDDEPEREDIVVITVTPRVVAYWNVEDAGERALA